MNLLENISKGKKNISNRDKFIYTGHLRVNYLNFAILIGRASDMNAGKDICIRVIIACVHRVNYMMSTRVQASCRGGDVFFQTSKVN